MSRRRVFNGGPTSLTPKTGRSVNPPGALFRMTRLRYSSAMFVIPSVCLGELAQGTMTSSTMSRLRRTGMRLSPLSCVKQGQPEGVSRTQAPPLAVDLGKFCIVCVNFWAHKQCSGLGILKTSQNFTEVFSLPIRNTSK